MLLFVYGSLKRGFWNSTLLSTATFIGEYRTVDNFSLIIKGGLPYVSWYPKLYQIQGEVYEVDIDTLAYIDNLEQNGKWYTRRPVTVVNDHGEMLTADLYFNDNATGEIQETGFFNYSYE